MRRTDSVPLGMLPAGGLERDRGSGGDRKRGRAGHLRDGERRQSQRGKGGRKGRGQPAHLPLDAAPTVPDKEGTMPEVQISATDGSGRFGAYVAMPKAAPAGAVVMIQEIFGVNATMRALSDWVADMGFIAISPDLFWRQEPGVQLDPDAGQAQWDKAFALMQGMDQDKAVEDLKATIAHARKIQGANGKVATMGFCLGGRLAFMTAARTDADANISYYGVGIEGLLGEAGAIKAPLILHIAALDKYVPPEAQAKILDGLKGQPHAAVHIYPGVDHAFARMGGHAWDARAAAIANGRTAELLAKVLG
jgi:carboxymethylenebutenolidase